ncbi:hypothetical protein [Qipengyuania nanhaisediminis]|uniref:hypothetical protein n=1 Tax=Qipengyuania nanhaisediminis TaxID=604088 RepID=UPI0038B30BF5
MTDHPDKPGAPWHLWVVGLVSLLWNATGATSYTMTKLGMLEGIDMPADQIAYYTSFPAWATAFWALGVWGSLFGSLALLVRSRHAVTLFAISIVGLVGTTFFQWVVSDLPPVLATTEHKLFAAAIWVITIGLFIYARRMREAGVLR